MSTPAWYVPLERRLFVPAAEAEESDRYDAETGVTARRVRQQDYQRRRQTSQRRGAA